MSKELKNLLSSQDKMVDKVRSPLVKLFRTILYDHNVTPMQWDNLVNRYLRSHLSRTPKNARDISQDKNNLNRAIAKETMSWNHFLKSIMILGPVSIRINIQLGWRNGKTTEHAVDINNPLAELDNIESSSGSKEADQEI
jgi:hypothetical protein